jgi:hypothetical protein
MNDTIIHKEKLDKLKAKIQQYKNINDLKHLTGYLTFKNKKERRKLRKQIFKTILKL